MLDPIVAGDTLEIDYSNSDYLSSAYDLEIALRGHNLAPIDIKALETGVTISDDGDGWDVIVTAAATANYEAGKYTYAIYAVASGKRYEIERGQVEVKAGLSSLVYSDDPRSHAKRVLDAIESVIEGRVTDDAQSLSINGRTILLTPIADLLLLRSKYQWEYDREVRAQRIAAGLAPGGQVRVRF